MNDLPTSPSTVHFDSHWFGGFFGSKLTKLVFCPEGLTVQKQLYRWQDIVAPLSVEQGTLFDTLCVPLDNEIHYVPWLAKRPLQRLLPQAMQHWARFHSAQVLAAAQECHSALKQGYVRKSTMLALIQRAQGVLAPLLMVNDETAAPSGHAHPLHSSATLLAQQGKSVASALTLLQVIARWSEAEIEQHQQKYIDQQMILHRHYFNTVESNPLTPLQQKACVINERSNLVLAGAGTGKTSTMVGRAGFLLASGQARAQQILLLAFGRQAAQEMDQRLAFCLPDETIKSTTFHALGLHIITEVEGQAPNLTPFVEDNDAKLAWLMHQFEQLMTQADYQQQVLAFLLQHGAPCLTPFDFDDGGDYLNYMHQHGVASLNGEMMLHHSDLCIANWLFRQGIVYEYLPPSSNGEHVLAEPARIFLPEYQITLITWLLDKHNQVPRYLDEQAYMARKQQISQQTFKLIEHYVCDLEKDTFFDNLAAQLTSLGVLMRPLSDAQIFEHCQAKGMIGELGALLCQMVGAYKACWLDQQSLNVRLGALVNAEQMRAAVNLLQPLLMAYQGYLASRNEIDFDDMIGRAINYVMDGRFQSPWRHILVDEFQDISEPRARLIRALRDRHPDNTLFCVGDDWQAIYRFAGSDVNLTTDFDTYFGAGKGESAVLALDKTFRFNNSIADVSSQFVCQNPAQLSKSLNTHQQVDAPAVSILRTSTPHALNSVLAQIEPRIATQPSQNKVLLLARYHHLLPSHEQLSRLNQAYPGLSISAMSVHASKGKEADFVVVLGLEQGGHGFPAQKATPFLLDALLPPAERFRHSEERRLFYVALTRAKQRVYLVTNMQRPSPFVLELLEGEYDVELDEFEVGLDQQLTHVETCPRCKSGTLQSKQGKYGAFMGCSHYPFCDYTEAALG
ncbi:UvrD-helicase domain-containing protein [Motilimonas eburnea]|uniref:UvrD-helicase domain-containing protein n=1 Tax=Motilimonas eburnea TaxID=1737488 RepID=UPI001E4EB5BA|nr:UvrD-helicase domain-containing protein [Motilimonas eburnea]MCE2571942.1 UvrD-helicase domain-containing protein [Motilimonas eburnea]